MFSLKNKVALVTGASQGIGRDTALALAEAGGRAEIIITLRDGSLAGRFVCVPKGGLAS